MKNELPSFAATELQAKKMVAILKLVLSLVVATGGAIWGINQIQNMPPYNASVPSTSEKINSEISDVLAEIAQALHIQPNSEPTEPNSHRELVSQVALPPDNPAQK